MGATTIPGPSVGEDGDEGGPGPLSRRERERLRHRQEILEAAEHVFVRKGYHGTTVEEIAQEAEFSVGTLYNFFEGKEQLYTEVILGIAESFLGAFESQVADHPDPLGAVKALVALRLRYFERHHGSFRVVFDSMPGSRLDPPRALPEACRSLYARYLVLMQALFSRGIESGIFEPEDSLSLTLCVDGTINAFIGYWSRLDMAHPEADQVERLTRTILRAVTRRPPGMNEGPVGGTTCS